MNDIGLLFAFAGGVLSFFSPCIFPLLPAYITHLTGSKVEDGKMKMDRGKLLIRSIGFVVGFSLIFIALGASASAVGKVLMDYRDLFMQAAGLLIIVFGLQMAGWLKLTFLMKEKRVSSNRKPQNFFGSVTLGMAFAAGWSPCVSLSLSTILILAGSSDTLSQGILLLGMYSLGMALPFFVISAVLSYSLGIMKKINRHLAKLATVNGMIMVMLGFLVISGQMQRITGWLSFYSLFQF
ncbi:cytochrome c biogenesis protein CcdA [Rossellomorea marisflavi]|uniref:cytochrome c biogenesis CcdA family protein n=1 Tax=Rossellomorea marisflavi TaxID=189381 RepID=UPI002852FD17|nr:cytochrome c biogenesis protein CcdA [Rossellomorea marisflavi]MDR4938095.1 cytochrome c biogenesis protein CcdA [Rossellomorea marisflavi]